MVYGTKIEQTREALLRLNEDMCVTECVLSEPTFV